jgi:hypothetical protein
LGSTNVTDVFQVVIRYLQVTPALTASLIGRTANLSVAGCLQLKAFLLMYLDPDTVERSLQAHRKNHRGVRSSRWHVLFVCWHF